MKISIDFRTKGIMALELMVVLSVLLIGLTIAIPLFLNRSEINRNKLTYQRMVAVKQAIVGDPLKMVEKSRTSFGFVGDLGVLPDNTTYPAFPLIDLVENRSDKYPYYQPSTQNIWFGWRGPYLKIPTGDEPRVSILDAWGNSLQFNPTSGIDPSNGKTRVMEIKSTGPDTTVTDDDIILYIYEEDLSNYVSGDFLDAVSKTIITSYSGQLNIYYPSGTSSTLAQTTVNIINGQYDTNTIIKIPVGHRYFETQDLQYAKIATLNGSGDSIVNFYGEEEVTWFEHDFDNEDNLTYLGKGGGGGAWKTDTDENGDYLAYQGTASEGDVVVAFGNPAWTDYKVEVEVSLSDSNKEDGFGIDYRANYSGSATPDTGYRFTYYPEPLSHFTVKRIPTDFVPPEPNYGGYGFGYFRFTVSVQTNPTTISHTIKIEKRIDDVLVTQTTISINENRTANSVLSGQVGLLAFGQLQSIRIHHVIVSPI